MENKADKMENKNQDNSLEELIVLLSPLEKKLVEMPIIGKFCEKTINQKYHLLFKNYKIKLY